MKTKPSPLNAVSGIAAAIVLVTGACRASAATLVDVNDWYAINGSASASIGNGNTSAPTYQNVANQNLDRTFSYFDPVTLSDGETLTLSFSLTLDLSAATKTFDLLRFGLFNSSAPHASTATFGSDRVATNAAGGSYTNAWKGFMLINPSSAANPHTLYRKTAGASNNYVSTTDTNLVQSLATTGGYSLAFQDDVARSYTFVLKRTGNDLAISGAYGAGTFSGTLAGAFSGGTYNVFDAFGFYASASDGVTINSAQFSNVSISVVPEPSSLVLLGAVGLLPLASAIRKRRFLKR